MRDKIILLNSKCSEFLEKSDLDKSISCQGDRFLITNKIGGTFYVL